jgi:predicted dehydrogenase
MLAATWYCGTRHWLWKGPLSWMLEGGHRLDYGLSPGELPVRRGASVKSERVRLGVFGAGMIATHPGGVLPNMSSLAGDVEVRAIASRTRGRAEAVAHRFGIANVRDNLTEMLSVDDLDVVINLTPVAVHGETNLEILESGRHLITEKPIASSLQDADRIIAMAAERDLRVIAAPPWMIDPRRAAARALIRRGAVGRVAFARSRSSHAGPADMRWPADPSWFYAEGAGALLDMGIYGVTEATGMFGPAQRVMAMSGITRAERVVRGGPFDGRSIPVEADDNTLLMLDFGGAVFCFVDATFNVLAASSPSLEVFGADGTLNLYEPFWARQTEPVIEVFRRDLVGGFGGWAAPDLSGLRERQLEFDQLQRAILVKHFIDCAQSGLRPVLSAEHARHTLEILLAAQRSARSGSAVSIESSFTFAGTALELDRENADY